MTGTEVVLQDMLACREARAMKQFELQRNYHCTLVSFCMNIPGPIKTNAQIRRAFDQGKEELMGKLSHADAQILSSCEVHEVTGDELLLAVQAPAEKVKEITLQIEEGHPLGRLFDMDVLNADGEKLSRKAYRKCLLCDRQAQECARARRHSVPEMQAAVDRLLQANL